MQPQGQPIFLRDNANRPFVTGEKERIGNSRTIYLIVFVLLVIMLGISALLLFEESKIQELTNSGTEVRAQVTDGVASTRRGSTTYNVTYEFRANDRQTYTRTQQVSGDHYDRLFIGDSVVVSYLERDPNINMLSGRDLDHQTNYPFILAVVLTIGTLIIVVLIWRDRNNVRLSKQGQIIDGQLTKIQGFNGGRGAYNVKMEYLFRTPEGNTITGKASQNRPDLRNRLPPVGLPMKVVYVSDRQYRAL